MKLFEWIRGALRPRRNRRQRYTEDQWIARLAELQAQLDAQPAARDLLLPGDRVHHDGYEWVVKYVGEWGADILRSQPAALWGEEPMAIVGLLCGVPLNQITRAPNFVVGEWAKIKDEFLDPGETPIVQIIDKDPTRPNPYQTQDALYGDIRWHGFGLSKTTQPRFDIGDEIPREKEPHDIGVVTSIHWDSSQFVYTLAHEQGPDSTCEELTIAL